MASRATGDSRPRLGPGPDSGYTNGMKTAISLPDDLFKAADELASKQGRSRSELYALALTEFLSSHGEDSAVRKLDRLAKEIDTSLDAGVKRAAARVLESSEW